MNIRKLRTESLIAETYMNSRQQWMSAQKVLDRKFYGQKVLWTESFMDRKFYGRHQVLSLERLLPSAGRQSEFPDELDKYQADLLLIIHQISKYIYFGFIGLTV